MEKAQEDLEAARALLRIGEPRLMAPASFHCQQAVEKALKGYLISRSAKFDKVHNLAYLFDLCEDVDPGFMDLREGAEVLTHFAVDQRYPSGHAPPTEEEVGAFLETAERVVTAVLSKADLGDP